MRVTAAPGQQTRAALGRPGNATALPAGPGGRQSLRLLFTPQQKLLFCRTFTASAAMDIRLWLFSAFADIKIIQIIKKCNTLPQPKNHFPNTAVAWHTPRGARELTFRGRRGRAQGRSLQRERAPRTGQDWGRIRPCCQTERAGAAQLEALVHRDIFRAGSAEQFAGADRVPTPFILSSINGAI